MTNCSAVGDENDGDGTAFTVLLFAMICFIALSMGCTITVDSLKEVRSMVKASPPLGMLPARCASSGTHLPSASHILLLALEPAAANARGRRGPLRGPFRCGRRNGAPS